MRLIDADALQAEYKGFHNGKRLLLIDVAPTVEPEPRWISCEESLPPSGTACFVTVDRNGEKSACISTFDHGTGWSNLEHGERVISWMRLPEMTDAGGCRENV